MKFHQTGWDKEKVKKELTVPVVSRYITPDGDEVKVYASQPSPEPGRWVEHGDPVYEIIGDAMGGIIHVE